MPKRPRHPCSFPQCPELVQGRYCDKHRKEIHRQYNQYERDPDSNKRYGSAWKKIRAAFLSVNPLCELCKREGKLVPATLVHHKRKLTDNGSNDWENLMSLCVSHHSGLHAEHGDYF